MLKSLLNIFKIKKNTKVEEEVKIKTEFPPYLFYDQDFELASSIKGLLNLGHIDQKPFEPYFYYKIDKTTTEQNINQFLDTLPDEFQFQFDKRLSPTSNASTITIVQRQAGKYLYHHFSHGQSNVWHTATRNEIFQMIFENRESQWGQSFRAYRMTKPGVEGQKAF